MVKNSLLFSKKGAMTPKSGIDIAMAAIFILAIGLSVVVGVTDELNLTGISATILGYAPLIVVAVFIYGVARLGGVL